jgi:hypothetical protein
LYHCADAEGAEAAIEPLKHFLTFMVYLSPFRFIIVNRENHNNGNKKGSEESRSEESGQESARKEGRKKEVVELQGAGFVSAPIFPPGLFPDTSPASTIPQSKLYNRAQ